MLSIRLQINCGDFDGFNFGTTRLPGVFFKRLTSEATGSLNLLFLPVTPTRYKQYKLRAILGTAKFDC